MASRIDTSATWRCRGALLKLQRAVDTVVLYGNGLDYCNGTNRLKCMENKWGFIVANDLQIFQDNGR